MAIGETMCGGNYFLPSHTEREFKVGDRVKINSKTVSEWEIFDENQIYQIKDKYPNLIGWIVKIKGDGSGKNDKNCLVISCRKNSDSGDFFAFQDLQLLKDPKCEDNPPHEGKIKKGMLKLNSMMKRLLDADTQKLVKVGFINGDLELTDKGRENLMTILFEEKKVELVKMAEEEIKEEKDEE